MQISDNSMHFVLLNTHSIRSLNWPKCIFSVRHTIPCTSQLIMIYFAYHVQRTSNRLCPMAPQFLDPFVYKSRDALLNSHWIHKLDERRILFLRSLRAAMSGVHDRQSESVCRGPRLTYLCRHLTSSSFRSSRLNRNTVRNTNTLIYLPYLPIYLSRRSARARAFVGEGIANRIYLYTCTRLTSIQKLYDNIDSHLYRPTFGWMCGNMGGAQPGELWIDSVIWILNIRNYR